MPVAPDHALRGDECVGDGFLGRFDGRPEQRADGLVVELANGSFERTPDRSVAAAQIAVARREGEEDVTALVLAGTTAARHAQPGALRERLTPTRKTAIGRRETATNEPVPMSPVVGVASPKVPVEADPRATGTTVDRQAHAPPEVRLHQQTDGVAAVVSVETVKKRCRCPLEPAAHHAGAPADRGFRHRPGCRPLKRREDVLRAHVLPFDVVQPAIPGLADHRQGPHAFARLTRPGRRGDERIAHDADRVRIGERDGRGQQPGLADHLEPRQLTVAVEAMRPREQRLGERIAIVRHDDRDSGAHRPATDLEGPLPGHERGVSDTDTRDIRDGIERTRRQEPDADAQIAKAWVRHPFHPPSYGWRVA